MPENSEPKFGHHHMRILGPGDYRKLGGTFESDELLPAGSYPTRDYHVGSTMKIPTKFYDRDEAIEYAEELKSKGYIDVHISKYFNPHTEIYYWNVVFGGSKEASDYSETEFSKEQRNLITKIFHGDIPEADIGSSFEVDPRGIDRGINKN